MASLQEGVVTEANVTSRLDTKELDELIEGIEPRIENVIKATAIQIAGIASTRAPYRYGALSSGIIAEKINRFLWWVHDSVEYGIFQELGTRRMSAHPFMVPAVEKVRARFNQMIAEIFK